MLEWGISNMWATNALVSFGLLNGSPILDKGGCLRPSFGPLHLGETKSSAWADNQNARFRSAFQNGIMAAQEDENPDEVVGKGRVCI